MAKRLWNWYCSSQNWIPYVAITTLLGNWLVSFSSPSSLFQSANIAIKTGLYLVNLATALIWQGLISQPFDIWMLWPFHFSSIISVFVLPVKVLLWAALCKSADFKLLFLILDFYVTHGWANTHRKVNKWEGDGRKEKHSHSKKRWGEAVQNRI